MELLCILEDQRLYLSICDLLTAEIVCYHVNIQAEYWNVCCSDYRTAKEC